MKIFHKFMDNVAGLLYVSMLFLVLYQVVARYFLNIGVPWIEEVSRLNFIYIVFLGAAISMRDKQAIRIEMIPNLLPEMPRRIMYVVSEILCFILLVLMIRGCFRMARMVWPTHLSTLDWVSNGWLYVAGITGFGYIILIQATNVMEWLVKRWKGEAI